MKSISVVPATATTAVPCHVQPDEIICFKIYSKQISKCAVAVNHK